MSKIVVVRSNFRTQEAYEEALLDVLKCLTANRYDIFVREEIKGIMIFEFESSDPMLANKHFAWLSADEFDSVEWDDLKEEG